VILPGIDPRQLDRAFDDLGASIPEESAVESCQPTQFLGQRRLIAVVEQIRDVQQRLRLVAERGHDLRVGITQRVHRQAAQEVQILPAAIIIKITALTPDRQNRQAIVSGDQHPFFEFDDFFKVHASFTILVPTRSPALSTRNNAREPQGK